MLGLIVAERLLMTANPTPSTAPPNDFNHSTIGHAEFHLHRRCETGLGVTVRGPVDQRHPRQDPNEFVKASPADAHLGECARCLNQGDFNTVLDKRHVRFHSLTFIEWLLIYADLRIFPRL